MRLIDADKLIEFIETFLSKTCKRDGTTIPNRWYGALKRCVEEQPTIETPKWIPISERLPEKNAEVLATTEWDCITIAEMFSNNDWFICEGNANAHTDEIIAWMPLPEPYKESEDKE